MKPCNPVIIDKNCGIGDGFPVFVIAEAGVNHNGDVQLAFQLVEAALESGADAVKFQTFSADELASDAAKKASYQKERTDATESQREMLRKLELSFDDFRRIRDYCSERGILFISTPFGIQSADLLDQLQVPAFKIPSGELTNHELLVHVARKNKPILLSTGMATLDEVRSAVQAVRSTAPVGLALFHCVSCYPAAAEEINLRAMHTLQKEFDLPVGFSDHTLGCHVSVAAVASGAKIIEKHFTLDRNLPGPDHAMSLEPEELHTFVRQIRDVEQALGDGVKRPVAREHEIMAVARRSIIALRDIEAGIELTREMLALLRPGTGIAPYELPRVVGGRAKRAIKRGCVLSWDDIECI